MRPHTKPNLREIAQRLDLSTSTVSRALRGHPGIRPETRRKVVAMAETLSYQGGHGNARGQSRQILVLTRGVGLLADQEYFTGLSAASLRLKLTLVTHQCQPESCTDLLNPALQPRALSAGQVAGIILIHRWPDTVATALSEDYPVVSLVHEYPGTAIDTVTLHDRSGMRQLVRHLLDGGYRRIGFFGFCPELSWSRARYAGYVEALLLNGQKNRPGDLVEVSPREALAERGFADGASLAQALRRSRDGVDAWVCASEVLARSLYLHLGQAGIRIPEDVGLTGFHATQSPGDSFPVRISSIEAPASGLGRVALRLLAERLEENDGLRREILLPCALLPGQSTRTPR